MTVYQLPAYGIAFPDPHQAEPDGLLAVGGDLSPGRLLAAYRCGIFPWYEEGVPILWWAPNPRFVLFPHELRVSHSMTKLLKKGTYTVTINRNFKAVIEACRGTPRPGQRGTWITPDMVSAYIRLHEQGSAVSIEAWSDGVLAGGLYGVLIGRMFYGESMFSREPNASKAAFILFARELRRHNAPLIDCQVHTDHLQSLGARHIPLEEFLGIVKHAAAGSTIRFEQGVVLNDAAGGA